jgi:hypothetical protein
VRLLCNRKFTMIQDQARSERLSLSLAPPTRYEEQLYKRRGPSFGCISKAVFFPILWIAFYSRNFLLSSPARFPSHYDTRLDDGTSLLWRTNDAYALSGPLHRSAPRHSALGNLLPPPQLAELLLERQPLARFVRHGQCCHILSQIHR